MTIGCHIVDFFSLPLRCGVPAVCVVSESASLFGEWKERVPMSSCTSSLVHVEVRLRSDIEIFDTADIEAAVRRFIESDPHASIECESEMGGWQQADTFLAEHVDRIYVGESDPPSASVLAHEVDMELHVYQPCPHDNVDEFGVGDADAAADNAVAATLSELPNHGLDGLWRTLVYSDHVKEHLLHYIYSTLEFSDAGIDFHVIAWNRVVLLHGPPGTGKTSLCRALAQKLAIRLQKRYSHVKLVDINSHSLFSKWFSESGKLVHRLFDMVTELVEDEAGFVVVLIDEVESVTKARNSLLAGAEPSDSIRVVNALLTELDKLKYRRNVLIMATSNLSDSIDSAFLDRADIRQYIGLPGTEAVYSILRSCMLELIRVGLVPPEPFPSYDAMDASGELTAAQQLWQLASHCHGASGRSLRRLPVLAHAHYLPRIRNTSCADWVDAMRRAYDESTPS